MSGEAVKDCQVEVEILILREIIHGKKHIVGVKGVYKTLSFEASPLQEINVLMILSLSNLLRAENPKL